MAYHSVERNFQILAKNFGTAPKVQVTISLLFHFGPVDGNSWHDPSGILTPVVSPSNWQGLVIILKLAVDGGKGVDRGHENLADKVPYPQR